jgi:ABC-type microcin C transport system duplicated ATPase subunit YejF
MGMEYSFTVEDVFLKYISNGCMFYYLVTNPLEVHHLTTRFHTQEGIVHVVNDVSFQLAEGETLGIVGESGCGKSVTMLSVMGLFPQPPGKIETGEIIIEGRNLLDLNEGELRLIRGQRLALIFQDSLNYGKLTPTCSKMRRVYSWSWFSCSSVVNRTKKAGRMGSMAGRSVIMSCSLRR